MNFLKHSELKGLHAPFSPSQPYWLSDDPDKIKQRYISKYIPTVGTVAHAFAESCIRECIKLGKTDKKMLKHYLLDNKEATIPRFVVDNIDLDFIFTNLTQYVNDAIGFGMTPEQPLFYSEYFFGTADAISLRNNTLRIHDLKTGKTPAHMEQLMIYAALYCLEYKIKPGELNYELIIYQDCNPIRHNPTVEEIAPIMDHIVTMDKIMHEII